MVALWYGIHVGNRQNNKNETVNFSKVFYYIYVIYASKHGITPKCQAYM